MLRRLWGCVGVVVVALLAVGAAQGGAGASPFGTWLGTPRFPHKSGQYDPIKLVAGPVWVQVESTGVTGASHDAATAKSTCTTRYRFSGALSADGWLGYVQEGKPKVSGSVGGGAPSNGICGSTPGAYRDAVRLRPAGAKLRVEFGATAKANGPKPNDFDQRYYKSGYLHR